MIPNKFLPLILAAFILVPLSGFAQKKKKEKVPVDETGQADNGDEIRAGMFFVDACTEKMLGDMENALLLYEEVLKLDPGNHAAQFEKADIFLEQREFTAAIEAANAAIAGDPDNYWYRRKLEEIFTEQGNYQKAIEAAQTIIKRFPPAYDDHARLADLAERSQQYKLAISHYKQAAKRPSGDVDALVNAARLEQEQNLIEDALLTSREIMAQAASDPRGYEIHMKLLGKLGREDEAQDMAKQWVKADPGNGQAKLLLAGFSDRERALDLLSEAFLDEQTDLKPKLKALDQAISTYGDRNSAELLALVNMLKTAHGNQAEIDTRAGSLYVQSGRYEEAAVALRKSLQLDPANESAWEDLLFADLAGAQFDDMKKDAEEALELYPNSKSLLAWYALWGQAAGDSEVADYALNKILKTGAGNSEAEIAAFYAWKNQGNHAAGANPMIREIKEACEQVKSATLEAHQSGEVLSMFENILAKNRLMHYNPDFLTYFGHAAKKAGKDKMAWDLWEKARRFGAKAPEEAL
ncbi:MAG: tetratricopeptide repeat protein [Bacteroidia bacterium]